MIFKKYGSFNQGRLTEIVRAGRIGFVSIDFYDDYYINYDQWNSKQIDNSKSRKAVKINKLNKIYP